MEIEVALPLDTDGFLRRECPDCEREFKWFNGETGDRPDDFLEPLAYHCPYCGEPAPNDHWHTKAQVEHMQTSAAGPAMDAVVDELARAFKGAKGVTFKPARNPSRPAPPLPMIEPEDMTIVASPCHAFEPVKVLDDWSDKLHCLVCGQEYRL